MSGLVNKIKEAVHSDKKDNQATDNPHSSNAGPHGSNAMNKADPRVDSDRDNLHSHGTHGTHGTSGIGSTGTHGTSGIGSTGTTGGYGSSNAGPHSSNMANKADPRVDSDRDGRGVGHGPTGTSGGIGNTSSTGTSGIGSTGTYGTSGLGSTGAGYGTSNAGPHSSNMANKADPRVDSDRDGRGIGHGPTGTSGGIGNTTGAGYGSTGTSGLGSTGTHGTHGSTNAGPHSSNIANKADPRVDSDLDGGRSTGFGTSGTGHGDRSGYNQGTTGAGLGNSGVSATPGSGDASKTAGPHNSDLMNKLDPRVDSDMDGSKTVGGNATHK